MFRTAVMVWIVGVGLFFITGAAQAQTSQDYAWCDSQDQQFSPDLRIAGCTAIIRSGKETDKTIALNNRGNAYLASGQHDRAIEDYNEAIRLNPEKFLSFHNRGYAYLQKGQYHEAIKDFNQAALLNATSIHVFNHRGHSYIALGQHDRAVADFDQAILLDPKNPASFNNRGVVYLRQGDNERAIEDFSEAIRLDPNRQSAFSNRCWSRAVLGRELQAALDDCTKSLRLKANDSGTFTSRGFVHIKLGNFDQAIADYSAAIGLTPKHASALYGRGYAKQKKGDPTGEADIAAAKRLQPNIAEEFEKNGLK